MCHESVQFTIVTGALKKRLTADDIKQFSDSDLLEDTEVVSFCKEIMRSAGSKNVI